MEYARSRIGDFVKISIRPSTISDYYHAHKNEFQTVDKVVWQDIFIPTSQNLPTVNDVKRFAEDLIAKCLKADDFDRLMVYNEGDSRGRNGEGLGNLRGEIRPAELEPVIWSPKPGQIRPVGPFPSGVHLVRVLKREPAGPMPVDEHTQKLIRKKLENQLLDREYRRIVRE